MAIQVALIGITNAGKSTVFNSLVDTPVETSPALYTTTKTNIGTTKIFDTRLEKIHELVPAQKITYATLELYDLPGISKNNINTKVAQTFFADMRQTDVLIHVVRCFDDSSVSHPHATIDPIQDIEWLEFELQVRDLDQIEKKLNKVEKSYKAGDTKLKFTYETLLKFKERLDNMQSLRTLLPFNDEEEKIAKDMAFLSAKPVIFLLNTDENYFAQPNEITQKAISYLEQKHLPYLVIAGKIEEEIKQLPEEEQKEFLQSYNISEPSVRKVAKAAYDMLHLVTFYTVGGKENRAWPIPQGTNAQRAAGTIHSDLEKGFIRAEVYNVQDLFTYGSEQKVKEAGKIRLEGKNYIVQDGDILHIRFNV